LRRSEPSSSSQSRADKAAAVDAALLEEDVEELYEHAPTGYLSSLPGGLVVKVNQTLLSWTGHRREELVGRMRLQDLLAPGARIYYETHYAPLLQMQGAVREIALELIQADGGLLPVLLNSTMVRDEAGAPRIVRTTVFNATDRRRYERELLQARADAESRARAALALAHVDDGVLLVSTDGRVDVLNAAGERILGVSAEDAIGREAGDVVPGWAAIAAHVPIGGPGDRATTVVLPVTRGGYEQWLATAGVESGDGVVYTFRDVSAEHRLEQLRNDMVATVSHELRTPLTGVSGSAQTLLAHYDSLDDATRRQLLELIVGEGERLTTVVDKILLTGRLAAGSAEAQSEAFDVAAVVANVRDSLPAGAQTRLVVEVDQGIRVSGQPGTTEQILASLVDNAIKYSAGAVRVRVEPGQPFVRLTVADEGPGIPLAERDRIFERFYRLDPDQQRGVGGTGLGLYIAKQLTARMGGRIGVLPSDRGTTVYVDMPAAGQPATR
jgi:PAS domain S-box-containing protein